MVVAAVHVQDESYLNDWPQRNVVLMQSSVKLVGSLHHSAARRAMVYVVWQISNIRYQTAQVQPMRRVKGGSPDVEKTRRKPRLGKAR